MLNFLSCNYGVVPLDNHPSREHQMFHWPQSYSNFLSSIPGISNTDGTAVHTSVTQMTGHTGDYITCHINMLLEAILHYKQALPSCEKSNPPWEEQQTLCDSP